MRAAFAIAIALTTVLFQTWAFASEADVGPALRAQAESVCRDDALRLCSDAIPDESAILACMRPKRASLTPSCRKIFNEVVRDVGR